MDRHRRKSRHGPGRKIAQWVEEPSDCTPVQWTYCSTRCQCFHRHIAVDTPMIRSYWEIEGIVRSPVDVEICPFLGAPRAVRICIALYTYL